MTLNADDIFVAGTGDVWVAPEGTELPDDLTRPLQSPWAEVGYITEDGVTFSISRDTTDLLAWQSAEPVRTLINSEPKTIAFTLLQWDRPTLMLALRGGTFEEEDNDVVRYTPPDISASDVRAMVVDAVDGDYTCRFCIPRIQISGDVEWQLVRTDAVHPTLTFSMLSSEDPWYVLSDSPGFGVGATGMHGPPSSSSRGRAPAAAAA